MIPESVLLWVVCVCVYLSVYVSCAFNCFVVYFILLCLLFYLPVCFLRGETEGMGLDWWKDKEEVGVREETDQNILYKFLVKNQKLNKNK